MKINIVSDYNKADLVTHSGTFHADEVFATVILNYALDYDKINLIRVDEVKDIDGKIIYDIGGGKYDHHQLGGNGERDDGIGYASFGLIWKDYGKKSLKKLGISDDVIDEEFNLIDKKLIEGIDAIDNGKLTVESNPRIEVKTISDLISIFNSKWDEDKRQDDCFIEAVSFANTIFLKVVRSIDAKIKARCYIEDAIDKSKDRILVLDKFMSWKEWLLNSKNSKAKKILYVVYPSSRGGYNAYAVPKKLGSFENRKPFPKEWSGLRGNGLSSVTGVKSATFCHNECFICGAETFDDIMMLAKIAVGG